MSPKPEIEKVLSPLQRHTDKSEEAHFLESSSEDFYSLKKSSGSNNTPGISSPRHPTDLSPSDDGNKIDDYDSDQEPKEFEPYFDLSAAGCSFLETASIKRKRGRKPD